MFFELPYYKIPNSSLLIWPKLYAIRNNFTKHFKVLAKSDSMIAMVVLRWPIYKGIFSTYVRYPSCFETSLSVQSCLFGILHKQFPFSTLSVYFEVQYFRKRWQNILRTCMCIYIKLAIIWFWLSNNIYFV